MEPGYHKGVKRFQLYFLAILSLVLLSCSKEEDALRSSAILPDTEIANESEVIEYPLTSETGTIELYDQNNVDSGLVLVNDAGNDRVYLMEKAEGRIMHEWHFGSELGNDAELLADGSMLASLKVEDPPFSFGGYGGLVRIMDSDQNVEWSYEIASENSITHHDVERLPNGNILVLIWDAHNREEAVSAGYEGDQEIIYTERLIEIDPNTNLIEWQWDSWDHLIQDFDPSKDNFGVIDQHPNRINLNYLDGEYKEIAQNGNIMHANGLDYDITKDVIYLSVNLYSEVWVIDHSTSLEEAAGSSGGNYNKGGDLIYRFGNPETYDNTVGERLFYSNHFPNILEEGQAGSGNMLIFINGNISTHSSIVYELDLPDEFSLFPETDNEPAVVWSFSDPGIFSPKVSGAERLPNGNTLITSGINGIWEVTPEKEIVWKFTGDGFYWRAYHYNYGHSALDLLGL